MDAQTYHDMCKVLKLLDEKISHERFTDNRGGTVPPEEMENLITNIDDGLITLKMLFKQTKMVEEISCSSN